MGYKPFRVKQGGFLPQEYDAAHDLCLYLHDVMGAILKDGEEGGLFNHSFTFSSEDHASGLEATDDPIGWMQANGYGSEVAHVLKCVMFPAALSDMLHCIYEALESSRKAKLNVTYMLLRKPLQENLFLFEEVVLGLDDFAHKLSTEPLKLRAGNAGGIEAHTRRIEKFLSIIGGSCVFDAKRIAELRHNKVDGFDGPCNLAMHLFTEHKAIQTEKMNINFIFSGMEQKESQWGYMYTYLPYVLDYMRHVVQHVAQGISLLDPKYEEAVTRQVAALVLLWADWCGPPIEEKAMETYADLYGAFLDDQCEKAGFEKPEFEDLYKMAHGIFPAESAMGWRKRLRNLQSHWQKRKQA
jgi:hypothetical protein